MNTSVTEETGTETQALAGKRQPFQSGPMASSSR